MRMANTYVRSQIAVMVDDPKITCETLRKYREETLADVAFARAHGVDPWWSVQHLRILCGAIAALEASQESVE